MTVRELAKMACKILGLFFMLKALAAFVIGCVTAIVSIPLLAQIAAMSSGGNPVGSNLNLLRPVFVALMSPVVDLCIGLVVWRQADSIATFLTRDSS